MQQEIDEMKQEKRKFRDEIEELKKMNEESSYKLNLLQKKDKDKVILYQL